MNRLLCIVSAMNTGGAETFLMKIYRCLDKSKYQMDFCVNADENFYSKEIELLGGKLYKVPLKSKHPLASFNAIKKIVRDNNYNHVIRVNEHSLSTIDLLAAKAGGAKVLIMRSSNAATNGKISTTLHKIFRFLTDVVPNVRMAPSTLAADYTFGKNSVEKKGVIICKNGLDIEKFTFSQDLREKYREEFGLRDKLVISHVGRFTQQKNHDFLIDIFNEIQKKESTAFLVLIGVGELEDMVKSKIQELGLYDKVLFLGIRNDVSQLLNMMDVFVFPSFFEGMPNTVIEAQTNGLPCIISDSITEEAKITDIVKFMSLDNQASEWASVIISMCKNEIKRSEMHSIMRESGYQISDVVNIFVESIWRY